MTHEEKVLARFKKLQEFKEREESILVRARALKLDQDAFKKEFDDWFTKEFDLDQEKEHRLIGIASKIMEKSIHVGT